MLKLALAALLLLAAPAWCADASDDDIIVRVDRQGAAFVIDVEVPLEVTPEEAWQTIADYDHMAEFISNITYSKVVSRDGNRLRVEQRGRASKGFLAIAFENVRDVVLNPPREIRTSLVSGNLKKAESVTRLVPVPGGSRLVNHGEYVLAMWLPPVVGPALIEAETREQYAELRAEIRRRQGHVVRTER